MELLLVGVFIGVAAGFLRYRTLSGLATQTLRGEGIIVIVLFVQLLILRVGRFLGLSDGVITIAWVLMSTSLLLLVIANFDHYWMWIAAIGLVLNIAVVSVNGGMPVEMEGASANRTSDAESALVESPLHIPAGESTSMALLGDRIPLPLGPDRRALVSIGDCVLAIGATLATYGMMKVPEHR